MVSIEAKNDEECEIGTAVCRDIRTKTVEMHTTNRRRITRRIALLLYFDCDILTGPRVETLAIVCASFYLRELNEIFESGGSKKLFELLLLA
jgi:hypothetical protein